MTNRRLAILGAGNMGRAIIGGLLRSGTRPEHISVGEALPAARAALVRDFGISASSNNLEAIAAASVVVLAVKPADAEAVLVPLAGALGAGRPLLLSVAAGIRVATLEGWCGAGVEIVRAMPNRPALVGAGATGLYAPPGVSAARREVTEQVMGSVGDVAWVPTEEALDVVTALSGSGPAYFFLLAEQMAAAGERLGLEPALAQRFARMTLYGAGLLAHSGTTELARLREEITSAGGTTEAALGVFAAANLRATVASALGAAAERSRELAAQAKGLGR